MKEPVTVKVAVDPSPAIAALDRLRALLSECDVEEILWLKEKEDFFEMDEGERKDGVVVFHLIPTLKFAGHN